MCQIMPLYDSRPNPNRERAGSKPSWQSSSNKNFMEDLFLRKREVEHRRNVLWDSTAKYFDRLQKQNKVFESWNTPGMNYEHFTMIKLREYITIWTTGQSRVVESIPWSVIQTMIWIADTKMSAIQMVMLTYSPVFRYWLLSWWKDYTWNY